MRVRILPPAANTAFSYFVPLGKINGPVVLKNRRGIMLAYSTLFRRLGKTIPSSVMHKSAVLVKSRSGRFFSYDFEASHDDDCSCFFHTSLPCLEKDSGYDKAEYIQHISAGMVHLSLQDIAAGYTSKKQKDGKKIRGRQKWIDKQHWQARAMGARA